MKKILILSPISFDKTLLSKEDQLNMSMQRENELPLMKQSVGNFSKKLSL